MVSSFSPLAHETARLGICLWLSNFATIRTSVVCPEREISTGTKSLRPMKAKSGNSKISEAGNALALVPVIAAQLEAAVRAK